MYERLTEKWSKASATQEAELLAVEITEAARSSFCVLFANGERYYYCTLAG
ncbi:hypothetical protein [Paenibacillus sp. FSL R7-0331]|uniref:hypothetical protein n=1 Tax=Paenibacillus sp. FSL R7-0331 TaxID=1536773 RepID=UPI000B0B84D7|nr:hypothetical protein [Paenibacillus sp. FSL R7-0331]